MAHRNGNLKQVFMASIGGGFISLLLALLMGTTFTYTYDNATPVGTDAPSTLDDQDRNTKLAIQERENVDHYWELTGTQVSDADTGEHRKITLNAPLGADPSNVANKGFIYTKDVSGVVELFWEDEDGNVLQLSIAGKIPQASIAGSSFVPAGSIVSYGGDAAPTGWLLCAGAAVSRTTYATLFAIIGTSYGVGDGATTFNLPDMRGRVPVGLDAANVNLAAADALGETGGEEDHTLLTAEMPAHTHVLTGTADATGSESKPLIAGTNSRNGVTDSTGGGGSHNNLQPYNTVNWIIKI